MKYDGSSEIDEALRLNNQYKSRVKRNDLERSSDKYTNDLRMSKKYTKSKPK